MSPGPQRQRALASALAEHLADPIAYLDEGGRYLFANSAYRDWFADGREDVAGLTPEDLASPELSVLLQPGPDTTAQPGSPGETEIVLTGNRRRCVRIRHIPDHDGEGGAFTIIQDLTEIKRAVQQTRDNETRWQVIYDHLPLPAFVWRKSAADWRLISFNGAARNFTRGMIERIRGISAKVMYADAPEILAAFAQCDARGHFAQERIEYIVKTTAEPKLINVCYVKIPDDQILVCVDDITDRYHSQQLLEQQGRDLDALLRNIPALIGYWDKNLTNRFSSHTYGAWFGIAAEKIPGMHMRDVVGEEVFEKVLPFAEKAIEGKPQSFMRAIAKPDHQGLRYVSIEYIPDDPGNGVRGFYVLGTDITEHKVAQENLESANRAKEGANLALTALLDEKEILLAEVHHRVKNNLQVITALIGMQSHMIEDPQALIHLNSLALRIRVMGQLHTRLYQSRDIGRVDMQEYLRSILDQALMVNRRSALQIASRFEVGEFFLNIETALPLGLIANEIISNSLKHAFDKTDQPELKLSLSAQGERYSLEIGDNGCGMKEERDPDPKLGLRLVQVLVRQLKGKIEFPPGSGTAIRIDFSEQFREGNRWR